TVKDYLLRTEMDEAQAEALANILDELATTDEVLRLEERLVGQMQAMAERLMGKPNALEERLFGRTNALEKRLSGRMNTLEERLFGRMDVLEQRHAGEMANLRDVLTRRMIAIVGVFGTIVTIVNAILG